MIDFFCGQLKHVRHVDLATHPPSMDALGPSLARRAGVRKLGTSPTTRDAHALAPAERVNLFWTVRGRYKTSRSDSGCIAISGALLCSSIHRGIDGVAA